MTTTTLHRRELLGIDRQDDSECSACGAPFEAGELGMVLRGHDSTKGAWCFACVAIVVEAMKAGRDD